jgi:hypothetical protein
VTNLQREGVKVLILVPLAVFAILFAIGPGGIVSYARATRVGVHTVLAFWISIPAALGVLAYFAKPMRANVLMISALFFAIVLHSGSAAKNVFYISEPFPQRALVDTTLDLLEFTMYALLVTGSMVCFLLTAKGRMLVNRGFVSFILIVPLAIYGLAALVVPLFVQELLVMMSYAIGAIAVTGFLIASFLVFRYTADDVPYNRGYFVSAMLLLCVAALATMSNLGSPSSNWEYAETLQMAAFLLICLAFAVPFLKRSGYRRGNSYALVIGLILMTYLPFLLTIILESFGLNFLFEEQNLFTYTIIHIGAASFSGMMAILLYLYPRKKKSWNYIPMVQIFGLWAAISLFLVIMFTAPSLSLGGEPIIPFVVGSIITLALLCLSIIWTQRPPIERNRPSLQSFAILLSIFISLVVIGEIINQLAILAVSSIAESPYGALLLLVSNLAIMFAFAYLIFLLAGKSQGKSSVEMYITFFLAMWILPNILKSYYNVWTTGWWVSEILLFVGLLAGPPLLIWLYVRAMHEVEESHQRANLYADLLMHDVSNYNQMMMMSMELLGSHDISESKRKSLADDGRQVISFSEQLISNVRLLSEADKLETSSLQSINLVNTIVSALDIFTRRIGSGELVVEFQPEESQAYVIASDLLVQIFLNILYSALECRKRGETVAIGIHQTEYDNDSYWQIDIKAPGRRANQDEVYSSGTIGLLAAQLMTESLKGYFQMERYARTDVCEGRLFTIRLHATDG